jgi:hypothetical protein
LRSVKSTNEGKCGERTYTQSSNQKQPLPKTFSVVCNGNQS